MRPGVHTNPLSPLTQQQVSVWERRRVEVSDLRFEQLNDVSFLCGWVLSCTRDYDSTVEKRLEKIFRPQGVSLVLSGQQCRIVLHTWPEIGALTLDASANSTVVNPLWRALCTGVSVKGGQP